MSTGKASEMALTYIQLDTLDKKLYQVHKRLLKDRTDEEILDMEYFVNQHPDQYHAFKVAVRGAIRERKIAA